MNWPAITPTLRSTLRVEGGKRILRAQFWIEVMWQLNNGTNFLTTPLIVRDDYADYEDNSSAILINICYYRHLSTGSDLYYKVTNDERRRILKLIKKFRLNVK